MNDIPRYHISPEGLGEINIDDAEYGDWVEYDDVKQLLEEIERLKEERDAYSEQVTKLAATVVDLAAEKDEWKRRAIERGWVEEET